jgi:hypothetical protein
MNSLLVQVSKNTDKFTNFSQVVSNSNNKKTICPEYYLLQAMGLKPNKPADKFLSFVESCDSPGGCGGPKDGSEDYSKFLDKLNKKGVDVISCGHIPQCSPVPLIYKRETFNNMSKFDPIVFILNDTSNGYRPNNIDDVCKVPLSYIEKIGDTTHVGIGRFISEKNKYSNTNKILSKTSSLNNYKQLLGTWNIKSKFFPYFTKNGNIKAIYYGEYENYLKFQGSFKQPIIVQNLNQRN